MFLTTNYGRGYASRFLPFPQYGIPSYANLVRDAGGVLYLDARKANGISQGINSPLVNPWVDLTKNGNDTTFQNLAGTTSDGWDLQAVVNSNGSPVDYANLVTNANFSNTNNWSTQGSSLSVGSGKLIFTGNGTLSNVRVYQDLNIKPANGKRLNIKCRLRVTTTGANSIQLFLRDGTSGAFLDTKTVNTPVQNQWYEAEFSVIATMPTLANNLHLFASHNYTDATTANGKIAEFEKPQVIYITDNPIVQAWEATMGRQITVAECDRIFAFTATSNTVKASPRPFLTADGIDSYGVLANNTSVDITGTEDFSIAWCGITPSVIQAGYFLDKNLDGITLQYGLYIYADGRIETNTSNTGIIVCPVGTIKPNTQTKIEIERKGGRLKCWVNNVLTYDQPNTTSLVSQPNLRLFARSTNSGGTTHGAYFKGLTAYIIIARGTYGDLNKLDGVLDRVSMDYR